MAVLSWTYFVLGVAVSVLWALANKGKRGRYGTLGWAEDERGPRLMWVVTLALWPVFAVFLLDEWVWKRRMARWAEGKRAKGK